MNRRDEAVKAAVDALWVGLTKEQLTGPKQLAERMVDAVMPILTRNSFEGFFDPPENPW